jgi:2,4-dienoyl-CoA reductase-like NADH-dependent reductase (Old Yellow Enzyme family)
MSEEFPHLFQPLEIRGKTIKNRIFFAPTYTGLANEDGTCSDANLAFIIARARGGVGMIVSEGIGVTRRYGPGLLRLAAIDQNIKKEGWRQYAEYIKSFGAVAVAQIALGVGKQISPHPEYGEAVAPSAIPLSIPTESTFKGGEAFEGVTFPPPRELTEEECDTLVEEFKAAALRLKECGFDGLEIHGAHGYLLSEFISPLHNQRTDKYGGSFEKRLTMPLALLKAAREVGGEDWIVGFRISSSDQAEGGYTPEDYARVTKVLEENQVDYISLSSGGFLSLKHLFPGKEAYCLDDHFEIKKAVNVPVLGANFNRPSTAEKALEEGKLDMAGLSRGLIADPDWPRKVQEVRIDSIVRCKYCNTCLLTLLSDYSLRCASNSNVGWERFHPEYWPPPRVPTHRVW